MRRGRAPSVERFRTLCQALELELHVGPPRDGGRVDAVRLSRALEITERAPASTGRTMSHADKAWTVSAVYDLMGKGRAQASATRVAKLIEAVAKARAHDRAAGRQGDAGDTPTRHRRAGVASTTARTLLADRASARATPRSVSTASEVRPEKRGRTCEPHRVSGSRS